jgi:hypothetical protein
MTEICGEDRIPQPYIKRVPRITHLSCVLTNLVVMCLEILGA